jgi:hypothetical protein
VNVGGSASANKQKKEIKIWECSGGWVDNYNNGSYLRGGWSVGGATEQHALRRRW